MLRIGACHRERRKEHEHRGMKHFFERLERKIDFNREYRKLEKMVSGEDYSRRGYGHYSINDWIEENFRDWSNRNNYISFSEVRGQVGFSIEVTANGGHPLRHNCGIQAFKKIAENQ